MELEQFCDRVLAIPLFAKQRWQHENVANLPCGYGRRHRRAVVTILRTVHCGDGSIGGDGRGRFRVSATAAQGSVLRAHDGEFRRSRFQRRHRTRCSRNKSRIGTFMAAISADFPGSVFSAGDRGPRKGWKIQRDELDVLPRNFRWARFSDKRILLPEDLRASAVSCRRFFVGMDK